MILSGRGGRHHSLMSEEDELNMLKTLQAKAECRQARKMAGKQACKMAGKQTFHIKGKDVLSAAPVQAPRFERIPSMFCLET